MRASLSLQNTHKRAAIQQTYKHSDQHSEHNTTHGITGGAQGRSAWAVQDKGVLSECCGKTALG